MRTDVVQSLALAGFSTAIAILHLSVGLKSFGGDRGTAALDFLVLVTSLLIAPLVAVALLPPGSALRIGCLVVATIAGAYAAWITRPCLVWDSPARCTVWVTAWTYVAAFVGAVSVRRTVSPRCSAVILTCLIVALLLVLAVEIPFVSRMY
jgi:hypothetical protein